MAGIKRKQQSDSAKGLAHTKSKKLRAAAPVTQSKKAAPKKRESTPESDGLDESDTSETENGFYGFSAKPESEQSDWSGFGSASDAENGAAKTKRDGKPAKEPNVKANGSKTKGPQDSKSSKEAHAQQRVLARERKAAKPNSDSIQLAKAIWERLRQKHGLDKAERERLVDNLLEIVRGRIRDFVFKHDAVRPIQCAVKYGTAAQRRIVADELKGEFRALAESKYAKFLVAKLLVEGDEHIRSMIIPEFYGHIRRLVNHPEASWIVDDVYRQLATPSQKAKMLREWYGPEFAIFRTDEDNPTADLSEILTATPEKRSPVMRYLHGLINQLIQKRLTGFTMLHDGMLQYFSNTKPGSAEATDFLELIKGDEEGDLLRNLAFTKAGSRVVCLALGHGNAKDRKLIIRAYREHIATLASDANGHAVLVAALAVTDDTKLTGKSILAELLGSDADTDARADTVVTLATDPRARTILLYPLAGSTAKWLFPLSSPTTHLLSELRTLRAQTSKKDPATRRAELAAQLSTPLLAAVASRASTLAQTPFGCQLVTETLLSAPVTTASARTHALAAVADLATGDPTQEGHVARSPHAGRMLRALAQGGHFDAGAGKVVPAAPPLGFADVLFDAIKEWVVEWACGESPLVVVNLVERAEGFEGREECVERLRKGRGRVEKVAREGTAGMAGTAGAKKKGKGGQGEVGSAGARRVLELTGST